MNIRFTYSPQYEHVLAEARPISEEERLAALRSLASFWSFQGGTIEASLTEITGLAFKGDEVCFLNSATSISNPLSVRISDDESMKDALIHELIHVLLTQNQDVVLPRLSEIYKKYCPEEPFLTRIHVIVHAIHILLAENMMPDRITHFRSVATRREYIRSWEIVDEFSAGKIVEELRKEKAGT